MKKLYIPTSTLNFNNILSSESISPKAFYEKRGFGYKRWITVKENDNENCTLLYENFCSFYIPQSEQENHPMLVEIDADESDFQRYADGVLYSDKTIYLNPWQTHFVFFSEKEKTITFSMSVNSLETKLVKLYTRYSRVEQPQVQYVVPEKKYVAFNVSEIGNDIIQNKMKGLLYGYYIGGLLSTSSDYVVNLTDLKEIRNIFSSVISNPNHNITDIQSERIDYLFDKIKAFEPAVIERKAKEKELYKLLKDVAPDKDMENFQSIFAFCFKGKDICLSYDKTQLVLGLKKDVENNRSINWINNKIDFLESHKTKNYLVPQRQELILDRNAVVDVKIIENKDEKKMFKEWCNSIFILSKYDGNIGTFKEDIATEITLMAKSIYGEKWDDNNPVRLFLNKLRRHIAGEVFDVKWNNNGLLYSVAAVLTNGEDWNKLLNYMQSKGMYDYRIAFAIFGELNGFANLTRDFTDILFECESGYISEVYQEFYKQLFGKELNGILELPKQTHFIEKSPIAPKIERSLAERVDAIIAAHPKAQISATERQAIDNAKRKDLTDEEFIKLIDNDMDSLSKGSIFHYLQKELYPNYKKVKKSSKKSQSTNEKGKEIVQKVVDLFTGNSTSANVLPVGQFFYCDKNVWQHIEPLITDNQQKRKIQDDFKFIQEAYINGEYRKKDGSLVKCEDKDNKNVIEHLYHIIEKKKYDANLVNIIVTKLKELYNIK